MNNAIAAFCALSLCVSAATGLSAATAAGLVLHPTSPAFWCLLLLVLFRHRPKPEPTAAEVLCDKREFRMDKEQRTASALFGIKPTEPVFEKNATSMSLKDPEPKADQKKDALRPQSRSLNDSRRDKYAFGGRDGKMPDTGSAPREEMSMRDRMRREREREWERERARRRGGGDD